METRWLGNVSTTLMVIVPYSLPSLKCDLSENMALLLQVSCSLLVIWQAVEAGPRVDCHLKGQGTLPAEEIAGSQHSPFPSLLDWHFTSFSISFSVPIKFTKWGLFLWIKLVTENLNNLLKCSRMTHLVCLLPVLVFWVKCPSSPCALFHMARAALSLTSTAPLLSSPCPKLHPGSLCLLPHTRFALLWSCLDFLSVAALTLLCPWAPFGQPGCTQI